MPRARNSSRLPLGEPLTTHTHTRLSHACTKLILPPPVPPPLLPLSPSLLDTLFKFASQVTVGSEATSFTENRFQLQIEERSMATFTNQSYSPELSTREEEFQEDFEETPLMDASITLPRALVEQLNMQGSVEETLRLVNYAFLTDSLFVVEENSELGQILANGTMIVGNVIIAASVAGGRRVEGLTEPVVIRFTQTKVCHSPHRCFSL